MTVSYLDVDDEITDAVARLRHVDDARFILVLPPGSRVATSRINFRLLAKEGQERAVTVALVSGDAGVRSLAISAGMPAYGSVQEAEASLPSEPGPEPGAESATAQGTRPAPRDTSATAAEPMAAQARRAATAPSQPEPPPRPTPDGAPHASRAIDAPGGVRSGSQGIRTGGSARPAAGTGIRSDTEQTRILPRSSVSGLTTHARSSVATTPPAGSDSPGWFDAHGPAPAKPRSRSRGLSLGGLVVRVGVLVALLAGALYVAYLTLPNVSITIEPLTEVAGPITVEIVADRSVTVADPVAGVVPAAVVDIPLSATDDFPATGTRVEETRAGGRVVLTSKNTVADVVVTAATRISTASGVLFETLENVTVPQADFDSSAPGRAVVRVRAVRPGPSGNVAAGTITRLPAAYADQLVEATNPNGTSGGERREVAIVTQNDYDDALEVLEQRLDDQLALEAEDPTIAPSGLVAFPETAAREVVTTEPTAGRLVDEAVETFTLSAESVGTILAVDEAQVAEMAAARLAESVPADARLFPESVSTDLGDVDVIGDGRIAYAASVTGEQYVPPDQGRLVSAIQGRSIDEARVILEAYGTVRITPWPDFVGSVPDDPRRINLTVVEPQRSDS